MCVRVCVCVCVRVRAFVRVSVLLCVCVYVCERVCWRECVSVELTLTLTLTQPYIAYYYLLLCHLIYVIGNTFSKLARLQTSASTPITSCMDIRAHSRVLTRVCINYSHRWFYVDGNRYQWHLQRGQRRGEASESVARQSGKFGGVPKGMYS